MGGEVSRETRLGPPVLSVIHDCLVERLFERGFQVQLDLRNEEVNFKVREHRLRRVPFIGVVSDREIENDTVTVRRFGQKRQKTLGINELMERMDEEIAQKSLPPGFGPDTQ